MADNQIILKGSNPYIHIRGLSYEDAGAYIVDNNDMYITDLSDTDITGNDVDTSKFTRLKNGNTLPSDNVIDVSYTSGISTPVARQVYIVDSSYGSNFIDKITGYFDKDNKLTNRHLQINTNFIKSHRDYIHLIKILIYAFILIIPLLVLTKINFISKPVAMSFTGLILILALLYIVYHLIFKEDAYLNRDKRDYDLIKFDDTIRRKKLIKDGIIDPNESVLSKYKLNNDCIGDECCTDYMTYDGSIRQCVPTNINVGKYWKHIETHISSDPSENITDTSMNNDSDRTTISEFLGSQQVTTIGGSSNSRYIILSDIDYNDTNLSSLADKGKISIGDYALVKINGDDLSYVIVTGVETFTNMSESYKPINPCINSCFNNITDINIDFFNTKLNDDNKITRIVNSATESILSPFSLNYKEPFNAEEYEKYLKKLENTK